MARRTNLYQRDSGRWTAYLRVNGEQLQKTFRTRDEALLWLTRMEQKRVMHEEVVLPKKITFAEFSGFWLANKPGKELMLQTREGYETSLRVQSGPALRAALPDADHAPENRRLLR